MRLCPNCNANVEGLIHHCVCCGALLNFKSHFFKWFIYEFPTGFSLVLDKVNKELVYLDFPQYESFLKEVEIELFCYPENVVAESRIKQRIFYSAKRKFSRITLVINYEEFLKASMEGKQSMIASALSNGVDMLQRRLQRDHLKIDELVDIVNSNLHKYL